MNKLQLLKELNADIRKLAERWDCVRYGRSDYKVENVRLSEDATLIEYVRSYKYGLSVLSTASFLSSYLEDSSTLEADATKLMEAEYNGVNKEFKRYNELFSHSEVKEFTQLAAKLYPYNSQIIAPISYKKSY